MKMALRNVIFLVIVLISCAAARATGVEAEGGKPNLDAEDARERDHARGEIIESRRGTIQTLLRLADRDPTDVVQEYVKFDAIQLLGQYRAVEATDVLSKHLDYFPRCTLDVSEEGPLTYYPAAEALAKIGAPTIDALLGCWMRTDISDQQRTILAFVIYEIDGKQLGLARLEIARTRARYQTRKTNLSRLIELYKRIDFQDYGQWPRPSQQKQSKG